MNKYDLTDTVDALKCELNETIDFVWFFSCISLFVYICINWLSHAA